MSKPPGFDVIIAGAGPAGLAAACLLAQEGLRAALVAPPAGPDPRTVALMQPTLRLLEYIGVWPGELQASSAPLRRQRIVDDTGALVSGPDMIFNARDMGLDSFAWNIPLQLLLGCLRERAQSLGVSLYAQRAVSSTTTADAISVRLEDGSSLQAALCIAADGARSTMRVNAGISTTEWSFDQSALVASFTHSAPHDDTSTEYQRQGGPCTVVPLPGQRSAVVWMGRPADIARLAELAEGGFTAELQAAIHGDLGRLSAVSARTVFAMRGLTATKFAAGRTLLAGESAHVVPPIGAQGLNMSFRDVALAADLILAERVGQVQKIVEHYDQRRRREVLPRQQLISAVNKSLLLGWLPADTARAAALWAVHGLAPLRQAVMSVGLGLSGSLPFAMRQRNTRAASDAIHALLP